MITIIPLNLNIPQFRSKNYIFHVIHYYIVTVIIAVTFLNVCCTFFLSQVVDINLNNILDLSRYSCNPK